jgi:PEP-CTERM motif
MPPNSSPQKSFSARTFTTEEAIMKWFRLAGVAARMISIGVAAFVALSAADARADYLYSSGPLGTGFFFDNSAAVYSAYTATESFTVAGSATVSSATVGLWTETGYTPVSIDWSIGTTAFGSDINSGTQAPLTNVYVTSFDNNSFSLYASSFNLTGSLKPGTTYYLTLTEGNSGGGPFMLWDANGGTSSSGRHGVSGHDQGPVGSMAFSLYGTPLSSVPEPSTFAFMVSGLSVLLAFFASGRREAKRSTPAE